MKRFAFILILLGVTAGASAALRTEKDPLALDGPIIQGALVRGTTVPGTVVHVGKRRVPVSREGYFVFGLGRKAPKEVLLAATLPDGKKIARTLKVIQRKYRIQRIDRMPKKKVTPPEDEMPRIRAEAALIRETRKKRIDASWYRERFIWPAGGVVTSVYGSQRILNGKPRRPHYGIDIAAPVGAPIFAPASGVVSMAAEDMFFTGHTLMIDHGHGVSTVYSHMSKLMVKKGQIVKQGEAIGLVGSTGRVTGPNLHWGLSLFGAPLDPGLMVKREPQKRLEKVTPKLPAP